MAQDSVQDSLYVIGIGGTGAKTIEAITQTAAVGLFSPNPIKILFVDPDESNGNVERARISLNIYDNCYQLFRGSQRQCKWLQTPIKTYSPDIWSPFSKTSTNKNLGSIFSYNNLKQNYQGLGHLFDVLYTQEEREANLDVGFRGRPAIGSAIMTGLDLENLDEEPWANLIQEIKNEAGAGKSPKIFLCGSIFGGTGASGLPTLGRLLANKLDNDNLRAKVKIACLFVLPYFSFTPSSNKEEVYASSDQFLLNTEAALRYYVTQAEESFDSVYLLGNQNFSQYKFSIGKNTQRNAPHFLELYAALAARHFCLNSPTNTGTVVLNSRQAMGKIDWHDLPDMTTVKNDFVNATRFAYVWLSNILPELNSARSMGVDSFQKGAPWFVEFFRPSVGAIGKMFSRKNEELPEFGNPQEQEKIDIITRWCQDYLRWLWEIHEYSGDDILLFRHRLFGNLDANTLGGEGLANLVLNDGRDQKSREQDQVQTIKNKLNPDTMNLSPPNQGTAGLAKALYILCRL